MVLAGIKEFFRKRLVHLKRKPEILPMLAVMISCMVYTFNLSSFSTAAIFCNDYYVAILVFVITLLSFLSIFTYLGAHDKKGVKVPMLVLSLVQIAALIVMDILCYIPLNRDAVAESERIELAKAAKDSVNHIIWLGVTFVLIVLKPVYGKLLNKIDTTIPDDEFAGEIETAEEVIAEDEQ